MAKCWGKGSTTDSDAQGWILPVNYLTLLRPYQHRVPSHAQLLKASEILGHKEACARNYTTASGNTGTGGRDKWHPGSNLKFPQTSCKMYHLPEEQFCSLHHDQRCLLICAFFFFFGLKYISKMMLHELKRVWEFYCHVDFLYTLFNLLKMYFQRS